MTEDLYKMNCHASLFGADIPWYLLHIHSTVSAGKHTNSVFLMHKK